MSTTNVLTGSAAIEYAEQHGLRLNKYADPTEGAREGLTVEEAREVAEEDASLIYMSDVVHCECGEVTGVRCTWTGPRTGTVMVEVMPEFLRASHTAAGNRGGYPANGAERLLVERSCADMLLESEGDWARVVAE